MKLHYVAAILGCAMASGCATLQIYPDSVPTEVAYQALNAADFAQTVTVARNPDRYQESAWPTHDIIGTHPSPQGAVAFGAVQGVIHYAVTGWLDREADATGAPGWNVAKWVWNIGTLYSPAHNVIRNHEIGLTLFGGRQPDPPPPIKMAVRH